MNEKLYVIIRKRESGNAIMYIGDADYIVEKMNETCGHYNHDFIARDKQDPVQGWYDDGHGTIYRLDYFGDKNSAVFFRC